MINEISVKNFIIILLAFKITWDSGAEPKTHLTLPSP